MSTPTHSEPSTKDLRQVDRALARQRQFALPVLVLIVGLFCTHVITRQSAESEQERTASGFFRAIDSQAVLLERELAATLEAIYTAEALAGTEKDAALLSQRFARVLERHDGLQSLALEELPENIRPFGLQMGASHAGPAGEIFVDVWLPANPATTVVSIAERRGIHAVLSINRMMENVEKASTMKPSLLLLVDESADFESRQVVAYGGVPDVSVLPYRYTRSLTMVAGRQWRLEALPTTAYLASMQTGLPQIVLIVGVVASLLAMVYLLRQQQAFVLVARKVRERTRELREANIRLDDLARRDSLTGLANRREFDRILVQEWVLARKKGYALSACMIDIDFFKDYNDYYGHGQGDACLVQVARALSEWGQQPGDCVGRIGGEEFAVLFRGDGALALERARQICQDIAALGIPHAHSSVAPQVTASVGVATATKADIVSGTADSLLAQADAFLYRAKETGRNQVVSHDD